MKQANEKGITDHKEPVITCPHCGLSGKPEEFYVVGKDCDTYWNIYSCHDCGKSFTERPY